VVRTARAGELLTALCDQSWPNADGYTWVPLRGKRDAQTLWAAAVYLRR
jgi:hypothetical protein